MSHECPSVYGEGWSSSAKETAITILVTGCCGLIGSEVVRYFAARGQAVLGIDNNMRRQFFGPAGDTAPMRARLAAEFPQFRFRDLDIRDRAAIFELFREERFAAVVHCAAQPSHDKAREFPLVDFEVNALGTLTLLEANRQHSAQSPFVLLSTNKVYGDAPNEIALVEQDTRWDYADPAFARGIPETLRIDRSKHSVFGASKVAADVMVQEYGRYFDMPTVCLRGGCLTGPDHAGVELHGFLSYLVKCNLTGTPYTVFGYKGKQVRDNIHSYDVAAFIDAFLAHPRKAAVYNIGGGRDNTVSILEAFDRVAALSGRAMRWSYAPENRSGDHICYYSDLSAIRGDYPAWGITKPIDVTLEEIVASWQRRLAQG